MWVMSTCKCFGEVEKHCWNVIVDVKIIGDEKEREDEVKSIICEAKLDWRLRETMNDNADVFQTLRFASDCIFRLVEQ